MHVCGDPRGYRVTSAIRKDSKHDEYRIQLATDECLPVYWLVRRLRDSSGEPYRAATTKWRKTRTLTLCTGMVADVTDHQRYGTCGRSAFNYLRFAAIFLIVINSDTSSSEHSN
ncbi:hypothetical protein PHYPSEUDO_004852 [Phytophthora pseudosyringae]|uniref:Uncharacterized protein n=1 Tax=Phytophthora pseudosyringae TaxID=221518 RepID=A0A8T1VMA3_9STRA|nr:hypothetical protein PHYPSEUDO_004852 [Phytophthora pseudosyringae]